MSKQSHPWSRMPGESSKAYAAFCAYYQAGPFDRSIDAAWRAINRLQTGKDSAAKKPVPGHVVRWSQTYHWVERATAYDDDQAERAREQWEQRRQEMREREWQQANRLRDLADRILEQAPKFVKDSRQVIPGQNGAPDREIITLALDAVLMLRALEVASKLQRLSTDEPTDDIRISGTVLESAIARELARLADERKAGDAGLSAAATEAIILDPGEHAPAGPV